MEKTLHIQMKAVDKTQLSLPLCLNGNLSITKPNMLKIEVLSAFKCQTKIFAESFSVCFSITMKPKSKFLRKRGGSVKRQRRNFHYYRNTLCPQPLPVNSQVKAEGFSFWEKQVPRTTTASKQQHPSLFPCYRWATEIQQDRKNSLGLQFPFPSTQPVQVHSWKTNGSNSVSK